MSTITIRLKRAYATPAKPDGVRILVERLWPRGLSKSDAAIDHWMKDVAPSPALRTWFAHRPERWDGFRRRYREELAGNAEAVDALKRLCANRIVTFVYAAKSTEQNRAVVLRASLLAERTYTDELLI